MKEKLIGLLVLYMLTATLVPILGLSGGAGDAPEAAPDEMLIWEAYAKGYISVIMQDEGIFEVYSTADREVVVDEYVQLLSPHPLDLVPQDTTQDGVLTPTHTVPPFGSLYYNYYLASGQPPPPPYWWCSEEHQFTALDVSVTLGGEIMPFALQKKISEPLKDVQDEIWDYQEYNPAVVIGKTPMWREIPDNQENEVDIKLAITNTGFVGAGNALVIDSILPGYSYDPNSFSLQPDSIETDLIGNTIFKWHISLDAAIWTDPTLIGPTIYDTEFISYTVITPVLDEGRHFLPRAFVDHDDDVNNDAHSAKPLLEVYHVNDPPVANAGGFYYVQEGNTLTLD
ncbi:MAG: hypothetical protein V3U09_00280, partial [Thermoplasmata archaeon]